MGGGTSFPKDSSDEEDMDEQAFSTVFFWLFSKVWHKNREPPKQFGAESRSAQKANSSAFRVAAYSEETGAFGWEKWSKDHEQKMGRVQANRPGGGQQKDVTAPIHPPLVQSPRLPHLPAAYLPTGGECLKTFSCTEVPMENVSNHIFCTFFSLHYTSH